MVVMLEARPESISLDPAKTALIVVDMQNAFLSPGGLLDRAGIDISAAPRTIQYLLFLGVATNVCVESTIRDAYFQEYWPILIADAAMQAGPPAMQEATLFNVEHFFGWVTTSEALETALHGR